MKSKFMTKIPMQYKTAFVNDFLYDNYHRLSIFSFFLIAEELTRLLMTRANITLEHLFLNYVMILFMVLIIPLAFHIKKKYQYKMTLIHEIIFYIIVWLILLWCAQMTLVELMESNNMNTITLGSFAIAALAFIHPRISFLMYSSMGVLFYIQLPKYSSNPITISDYTVDTLFILFIAFFLSRIIFKLKLELFIERSILKDSNKKLFEKSITDTMTQLYNHTYTLELLTQELSRSNTSYSETAILLFDIDNFKSVNDTYGHSIGDQVIINIASIIKDTIRQSDYAGRYGGEEFIIIFPNTTVDKAYSIAENLRKLIESSTIGDHIAVTISGGLIQCLSNEIDDNITAADIRLYKAKDDGKNRILK